MDQTLKVLFLAAEAAPFAKVGGLADVAAALPKALRQLGVDARLMIPRYGAMRGEQYDFRRLGELISVPVGPDYEPVHLLEGMAPGEVPLYLIWDEKYFSARDKIYGFNDDPQRFVFFSRAVIAALRALNWVPDVIHANDWHTAPVPAWLDVYGRRDPFYRDIVTLFTIHNLAYQGLCGRLLLTFGRMEELPHLPVEPPGQVNWMAQGLAHADLLSTVSPTYAREILTAESGMGLEPLLISRQDRLFGVLSGIDAEVWNPSTDTALTQAFDVTSLRMRAVNKSALQREIGLPGRAEVPLLGCISRLDEIKGVDLLLPALEALLQQQDVQFVLLGTGDPQYETELRALAERFPESARVFIKFDDRLARRIYGGVDLFLVPSRFEPWGMGQLIAMRYGAVPLVRATGGLADTVIDVVEQPASGTGFVFRPYTVAAFAETLGRALAAFRDRPRWEGIQRRAMEKDFSWEAAARTYIDLYRRAQALHRLQ